MGARMWRSRRRAWRGGAAALAVVGLAVLLAGCGAAPATLAGVGLAEPTATTTATPRPTPTATATLAPTATATPPRPTATATPRPPTPTVIVEPIRTPTPTTLSNRPTAVPGGYVANWARWAAGEQAGQFRRSYDRARDEYHVALLADDQQWSFFAPENQNYGDFTLEVEAALAAGADQAGYGLAFRRQKAGGDTRYIFYVTAQGRFALALIKADGTPQTIRPLDAAAQPGAIRVGQAANRLRVTCQGATIILAVNGVEVHRLTNATITQPGEVGIFVYAPAGAQGTEVVFRDFQLAPVK